MKLTNKLNIILPSITIILLVVISSCSKADRPEPTPVDNREQLVITASKTTVLVNEVVSFTVTAKGNAVPDAASSVFIDGKAVNLLTWRFTDRGTYTITAKKEGYKDSNPQTITVTEPVKIVATQVAITPRSPGLGVESKMCYGDGKIYTYDRANERFMSYDIATKKWAGLDHGGQLEFAGYSGKMIFDSSRGRIYYFNGNNNIYRISANAWEPKTYIDENYAAGEAAYVLANNGHVFSAGGRMYSRKSSSTVRKYVPSTNVWENLINMPVSLSNATAVLNANNNMYIIGEKEDNTRAGVIFNTSELTSYSWALPKDIGGVRYKAQQMAIYKNYLFYSSGETSLYVYNISTGKWIDVPVAIHGDFLSSSINLFVSGDDFYAAGEKGGNFALYKLQVSFTDSL